MNRIFNFIEDNLYKVLLGMAVIIICLIGTLGISFKTQSVNKGSKDIALSSKLEKPKADHTSSSSDKKVNVANGQLYVDVKGAVKHPGVYQVNPDMRFIDAINLAGGFNNSADKKQINLAQRVADQGVIYVPIRGEIKGNISDKGMTPQEPASIENATNNDTANTNKKQNDSTDNGEQINLNTADKAKLQELNGIGDKKADQIIAYRQEHGDFKKIEDLQEVSGFGEKTFQNLKDSICV